MEKVAQQLRSDSYRVRRAAASRLLGAGQAAVDILAQQATSGDLEPSLAAISILEQIASAAPLAAADSAYPVLKRLSEEGATSVAPRATEAVSQIQRRRSSIARERLSEAGLSVGFGNFLIESRTEPLVRLVVPADWEGDPEVLDYCRWLHFVAHALVTGPAVDAEVIERVALLPDLEVLVLHQTPGVDAAALEPLKQVDQLMRLELRYVPIAIADIDALAELPIQQSLTLFGTGIPPSKSEEVSRALPRININITSGAFLGITGAIHERPCVVSSVVPGTAADEAGMQQGDIVTQVAEQKIRDFTDLQEAIGMQPPNVPISIKVLRQGEPLDLTVKLKTLAVE